MSDTTALPRGPLFPVTRPAGGRPGPPTMDRPDQFKLRVVPWVDPVADAHGLHPCSRYVELYWLRITGPSTMGGSQ
jgi:hypothetical protein